MAPFATVFQFGVYVNGILQPGTISMTAMPTQQGFPPFVDDQQQLTGECIIACYNPNDNITLVNLSGGNVLLKVLKIGYDNNSASMTVVRLGTASG